MRQADYDRKQTAAMDAINARLRSIASQAVEAQSIDCGDPLGDLLMSIEGDLKIASAIHNAIQMDDVDRAERIARTGRI